MSISKSFLYCLTKAFLGWVNIFTNASLSNDSKVTTTGNLPTNSGISPNFNKSLGIISLSSLPTSLVCLDVILAPNPIELFSVLFSIILSTPSNAPPQINKILEVFICKNSWCGCFLPPWGGTEAVVPSSIFNNACWTH